MRYLLTFAMITLISGCIKKTRIKFEEVHIIERDTDILTEEDLEDLPESK